MSYVHLINCVLLTFGPLNALYRARKLHLSSGYLGLLLAVCFYVLTSSIKTILMAFLLTSSHSQSFSLTNEVVKNSFNMLDCFGLYFLIQSKSVSMDNKINKIFLVAIGWTFVESLFHNGLFLFINASADAFTWASLFKSLMANFDLFDNICLVALVIQVDKLTRITRSKQTHNFKLACIFVFLIAKMVLLSTVHSLQVQRSHSYQNIITTRAIFTITFYIFTKNNSCFV